MAEKRATTVHHYLGLSTDTKATIGVPVGSTWYETDTQRRWVYDGAAWSARL